MADFGLTGSEAAERLKHNGPNEIPQKKVSIFQKLLHRLFSPISLMLFAASFLSFFLHKIFDGSFILVLLGMNVGISLWQEGKADKAIEQLNEHLSGSVKTMRDGAWKQIDSRSLVQGDVVQLLSGDVVPADGKLVEANRVAVNESSLTGESLPREKQVGDTVFSGSFLTNGLAVVEVTATGRNTSFGKTLFSVERVRKQSLLEKDVLMISKFLTLFSLLSVVILTIVFLWEKNSFLELLTLDLSLLIAGVPVSLPTVMTLIIELGVVGLAKKKVIVRRLSALEDLSNINFLLTDKTGTLTKNKIGIKDIYAYDSFTHEQVLLYAALASGKNDHDPIDQAIVQKAAELRVHTDAYKQLDFHLADSNRKRSTAVVMAEDGKKLVCSLGAPQIVAALCQMDRETRAKFDREVSSLAGNGYRALALAIRTDGGTEEEHMHLAGLLALSDILRDDARSVIQFMKENGIGVAMVTGDNRFIARVIARELALDDGKVVTKSDLEKRDLTQLPRELFDQTGAFAEILPEDKFALVEAAKRYYTVASNGDGVNDIPAVKAANVGFAVSNAVAALKSTADIVLLTDGISVIRDAIIESRKIFARLYTYSLYRISESLRLIITIAILGLIYRLYPLTPLQLIVLALLNDIPIISLAYDKVRIANRPAKINAKSRFILSSLYGLVGVGNSLLLFLLVKDVLHLPWEVIQTIYFLKLTVSGHMLIYVAHTKELWYKFLPSKQVIWATSLTQVLATVLALTGFLMPGRISVFWVVFVWIWSLAWMQIGEWMKDFQK
jgi:H+-transporting ATPase